MSDDIVDVTTDDAAVPGAASADRTQRQAQAHQWQQWLVQELSASGELQASPLEEQCREVVKLWTKFSATFSHLEQPTSASQNVPTISTLQEEVTRAERQWSSKQEEGWGKTKHRFFSFIDNMDDHSYLFSFIPDGDKYISLFTGVISSVVKVSVNYKKIAEGFNLALVEISDDLRFVRRSSRVSNSPYMKELIVRLYVQVFRFLCYAMQFYQSRKSRIKASLNHNFYNDQVQKMVCEVQRSVQLIRRESEITTQDRIENTGVQVSKLADHFLDLKIVGQDTRTDNIEDMRQKLDLVLEHLINLDGRPAQALLSYRENDRSGNSIRRLLPAEIEPSRFEVEPSMDHSQLVLHNLASGKRYTRHEIGRYSSYMDSIIEDGRAEVATSATLSRSILPTEIFERLRKWTETPESGFLWIKGVDSPLAISELSLVALQISTMSMKAGLPCVSFLCKRRYQYVSPSGSSPAFKDAISLVILLFSVIKQLVSLLPHEFTSDEDFGEVRFLALKDNSTPCSAALDLIRSLLMHAPPSFLVVIDGLQLVHERAAQKHLSMLIDILRSRGPPRMVKVLFSTAGNSFALSRSVKINEQADGSRIAQGTGLLLKGGTDLTTLCM